LCRQQAEVIQNRENEHIRNIGQDENRHRKHMRFKLGHVQVYDRSTDQAAVVAWDKYERHDLLCKACTDRGLLCSAKGRIYMIYVRYVHLTKAKSIHRRQSHPAVRQDVT
jgi:hypothetical protein